MIRVNSQILRMLRRSSFKEQYENITSEIQKLIIINESKNDLENCTFPSFSPWYKTKECSFFALYEMFSESKLSINCTRVDEL